MIFSDTILLWYSKNGRILPWRTKISAYRVLISEIMLQQTQVPRVIEKFHEFLELFPTLNDLASASKADVIKAWSGLGYNRRAVLLHKFAQVVIQEHGGIIPKTREELIRLPGIGPYAAGSIASFAFNKPEPAIDVNVRRIYHRYFEGRDQGSPGSTQEERELFDLVKSSIPKGKSCDFHNALMDFGSLVCTRKNPHCDSCPLVDSCTFAPIYKLEGQKVLHVSEKKQEQGKEESGKHVPNRIFRGRIVEWIRHNEGKKVSIDLVGSQIKEDYSVDEQEWLQSLISKLEQEGLIQMTQKNETIILHLAKN